MKKQEVIIITNVAYLANLVEVVQDVWRVGHPYPQPASVWNDLHQPPQEVGQGDPNVPPVGARVLARQPDLHHTLLNRNFSSLDDGFWVI